MGLFQFIKDAGEKLFGAQDDDGSAAEKIAEAVKKLGLDIEGFGVEKQGDKVTVTGKTASQDIMEKVILAAGNHFGIGQVESKIETAEPTAAQPQPVFYTVKSGDTLSKIAKQQYGDANRYNEIFEANRPMLSHPDKIYPGQQLRIPQQAKSAAA